ncbi:MAG: hypothetical protein ACI4QI_06635, partial [Candidatus Coproplasma sp.]
VKKLLKKEKSAVMPSDSVKRRIMADCGVDGETATNAGGGTAVKVKRNIAVSVGVCCAAAVAAITCAIILVKPSTPSTVPDVFNFGTVSSATEFYAYSAVSVGNMLDGIDSSSTASAYALAVPYGTSSDISAEITDLQKKTLDKYAVFATGMLGEGKITSSCTTADIDGYEFKLNVGYNDVFGSSSETVLYFNKVEGTIKIDGDDEEYEIEGVLIKGDVSYPVEGKYEIEKDGNETENELVFTAYTSLDRNSYIRMKYEYEVEDDEIESKVVVTVRENGDDVETAVINGETGEDTSFNVEIERYDGENVEIKFNPYEENGEKFMQVDAWFGEYKHELIMQNKPWEQGGGFDFINRSSGEPVEPDDWEDWDDDKEDKDDKDEPIIPPPDYPDDDWDKDDEKDWEYESPYVPPYGLGL